MLNSIEKNTPPVPIIAPARRFGVAVVVGMATLSILVVAVAANGWYVLMLSRTSAREHRQEQVQTVASLLLPSVRVMLEQDQLSTLRRLMIDSARTYELETCRVLIGPDRTIADAVPSHINQVTLPDNWTQGPLDAETAAGGRLISRQAVTIPNRGQALLEVAAAPGDSLASHWEAQTGVGLIGVGAIAGFLLLFRRMQKGLRETDVIASALLAYQQGERSVEVLSAGAALGDVARSFNALLNDLEASRHALKSQPASADNTARRQAGGLEAACDAMSQGMLLVDEQMRVRFANGAAAVLLNRTREQITSAAIETVIADPSVVDPLKQMVNNGSRRPVIVELEGKDPAAGGVLKFSIRPVRKGDSGVAMIFIEDVTQQRIAERARNSFVAHVTHELRTPLTNIRLYAETAIESGSTDAAVNASCMQVINIESRRLERIVSEMLSVSEIEAGSFRVHKDDVNLEVLAAELKTDYEAQAREKNITLDFVMPPKVPMVQADRDKLAVALHNLLSNALKYTPDGGKVTFTIEHRAGDVLFEVADTGIGINPDESEKIFDRFYRSEDPRVGKIVGTGLGLTLAREVIRLHGGDITLQSEMNRGSTFTATLPLAQAA